MQDYRGKVSSLSIIALPWLAGILTSRFLDHSSYYYLISISALALGLSLRRARQILLLAALFFLAVQHGTVQRLYQQNHISLILANQEHIKQPLTGRIISEVEREAGSCKCTLQLETIAGKPVSGLIRFLGYDCQLHYGDRIGTVALIRPFQENSNPLGMNFRDQMSRKGIHGFGMSQALVMVTGHQGNFWTRWIITARRFMRQRIAERCGERAGFLQAVLIGDRSDLEQVREQLVRAGLSHILAVSGLHVGILTLVFHSVLKIFLPFRNFRKIFLIFSLLFYAAVCNWSASVTRAVLMISLYLIAGMLQRRVPANHIVIVSLLIITAVNPDQLFSVGLQMSYTAVLVLINVVPDLSRFLHRTMKKQKGPVFRMMQWLILLTSTSLILSLTLSPYTLYYFNQTGLNGVLGNILGIPFIAAILPLTMFVIFLPPGWGLLISIYQQSMFLLLSIFQAWVNIVARVPLYWDFIPFSLLQFLAALSLMVLFIICFKARKRHFVLYFMMLMALFLVVIPTDREIALKITFFDCGLGDMALVESPAGQTLMIDCGPPADNAGSFNNSALPYLQKSGISSLDWLIITHAHNDHYGGFYDLMTALKVKNLVVTDDFRQRQIWPTLEPVILEEGCQIIIVADTLTLPDFELELTILHPDRDFYHENVNNMSIVCRLDYGDFSVLFNGDLEEEGEEYLLNRRPDLLDCDLVKVGHHGSSTSSSPAYLEAVSPDLAFIPTSLKNRFNFPHQVTLDKYSFLEDRLIIAGKDGALQVFTNGSKAQIKTFISHKLICFERI